MQPTTNQEQLNALVTAAQAMAAAMANQNQLMQQILQQQQQQQQHQPPPPLPADGFHTTSLAATPAGPVDHATGENWKWHDQATWSLFHKKDNFDVEPSKFKTFIECFAK